MPEERKPEEFALQVQPQTIVAKLEAQGRGFDPHGRRRFFGHSSLRNLAVMTTSTRRVPTQPWLRPNHCNCGN